MPATSDTVKNWIIGRIQSDFPVTERPFLALAEENGVQEGDVIREVETLIEEEVIREFNPVFDARKLGYVSTLAAVKIDHDRVAELAADMIEIQEITHNYLRENDINLWFTITARDEKRLKSILKQVHKFPGVQKVMNLPVQKTFKIRAVFGGQEPSEPQKFDSVITPEILNEDEQALLRALQHSFPVNTTPFKSVAERTGMAESDVLATINRWVENGVIRRFGARLNHRRAGYKSNMLTAWKGADVDDWGQFFAGLPYVSHCYCRATNAEWKYELYAMVHAKTDDEMKEHIKMMETLAPGSRFIHLKTLYELKKTAMKYFLEDTI